MRIKCNYTFGKWTALQIIVVSDGNEDGTLSGQIEKSINLIDRISARLCEMEIVKSIKAFC